MDEHRAREKWDARYRGDVQPTAPLEVLVDNQHLLPTAGDALDVACGRGASGLFLAARGLRTWAWDLSPVAIERLRERAADLPLIAEVCDVVAEPPPRQRFDVICVGHFLDRRLCTALADALRPGGLLFYQTFTRERIDASGPDNPLYRLAPNELLRLFPDLIVRVYREEGTLGDTERGFRNRAQLVAQRPARDAG